MKKILFDCGANIGGGYRSLSKKLDIDDTWEIHMYEPNPDCILELEKIRTSNIQIHECAVYTENCNMKLYGTSLGKFCQGSTLHNSFHNQKYNQWVSIDDGIEIKCVNLAEVIKPYIPDNEIYIKLDIEGSEYDVCEHLISTDVMRHVKKIFIEFHERYTTADLIDTYKLKERRESILRWLNDNGVEFKEWF